MMRKKVFLEVLICLVTSIFISSLLFAEPNEAISDLQKRSAVLNLNKDIKGKIMIFDQEDSLVVKLSKAPGKELELLLKEGEYRIVNVMKGEVYELGIMLERGERLELSLEEFMAPYLKDTAPQKEKFSQDRRETILRGKSTYRFFAEIGAKTTSIHGETGVLMGGNFGFTVNRIFSFGVAGYGKANFDPGLPGYGGITFAYIFSPLKETHVRVTALAGSGTGRCGGIFYIFEPGVELVLNLSRVVRIQAGLSIPFVDKKFSGLDTPMLCVSFQLGK